MYYLFVLIAWWVPWTRTKLVAVALLFIVCVIALFSIVVFVLLFNEYVKPE